MMYDKLCVTQSLRQKVMTECHAPPYAGCHGMEATVKALESFFYWTSLR